MLAVSVTEILQEIGSYAGFAAVLGLAVLSALYFSQARDVRRLREWAGRAPERSVEIEARMLAAAASQEAAARRDAETGTAAEEERVAQPAAAAATANAGQGTPSVLPATASAAAAAGAGTAADEEKSEDEAAEPEEREEERQREKAPAVAAATGAGAARARRTVQIGTRPGTAGAGNDHPPTRTPPARPVRRMPSRTSVSRPAPTEPRAKWYSRSRWPAARYIALAVVGVLVVGGAAAVGIPKLLDQDDTTQPTPAEQRAADRDAAASTAPVEPTTVTVSVLNGTTVPGLAAAVGDRIEAARFNLGNVTNASEQQRAESVAMFTPGANREARAVARKLGISQIEPIDAQSAALAGDASVVVVVGADQTE